MSTDILANLSMSVLSDLNRRMAGLNMSQEVMASLGQSLMADLSLRLAGLSNNDPDLRRMTGLNLSIDDLQERQDEEDGGRQGAVKT